MMADTLLLNRRSLETCPPELRQSLAYVLHLRSHWKPEGRAKLIVPTSWMEFLTFADGKCGTECATNQRCPFRNVRFEGVVGARMTVPDEELPQDVLSQVLTSSGIDACLATLVPRAFEGVPLTSPRSDIQPAMSPLAPRIDFTLVPGEDGVLSEDDVRCLLFGMKEPMQYSPSAPFDSRSGSLATSIPEELTNYGQFHLSLLTSLIKGGTPEVTAESFPEWLLLFGLLYDGHHLRIIACLPRRRHKLNVIDCVAYIVDEFTFRSDFLVVNASVPVSLCERVLARFRLLLALTSLRRHVSHLSKSLFTTIGPCDDIGRTVGYSDDSRLHTESLSGGSLGSSLHCSSEYSTCPSSVRPRESSDILIECGEEFSSCNSLVSSFSSICSSLLGSDSTSNSFFSEDSKYTDPNNYTEPPTENVGPNNLTEIKRQEIVAWARRVIPSEHPIKDTYKMVVHYPHSRRPRVQTRDQVRADRH